MPRKRKVTLPASTNENRPRLHLPDGEEGKLLTAQERKEKIELFLADYDEEVANRLHDIKNKIKSTLSSYNAMCQLEIIRYPKHILEMPLKDFLASGGSVDTAKVQEQNQLMEDVLQSTLISKSTMETISEDGTSIKQTEKKRNKPPAAVQSTVQKTRQSSRLLSKKTPLNTKPLNYRMTKTPATAIRRQAKAGELMLSVNGSPIAVAGAKGRQSEAFSLTIGNDKVVTVPKNRLLTDEEKQIEALDPKTKQQLELMHENIATILKVPVGGLNSG